STGSSPALTSELLPQPDGPYIRPTGKVVSASALSIRSFQNRTDSGNRWASRGPGSSSRKNARSSGPNERKPFGKTGTESGEDDGGGGGYGRGGAVALASGWVSSSAAQCILAARSPAVR